MKIKYILLFGVVAAFTSCSTAYRSGQTPDDVYYSPAPEQNSYVSSINEQDRNSYSYRNDEEAQIRQGIQNPIYRTPITLDLGYGYGYSPYNYAYNNFGNPFYNNSFYNNYYDPYGYKGMYNPYAFSSYGYYGYTGLGLYSPLGNYYNPYSYYSSPYYGFYSPVKGSANTTRGVRRYNINPYYNNNTSTSTTTRSAGVRNTIETTAPTRRTTGVGNVIRRVFTPSNNREYNTSNNNNNRRSNNSDYRPQNTPTRTFSNPPSVSTPSSSGNSSSNNSSAPVRTFRR